MAKTRGVGLLMVWSDMDPDDEAEFNRWYDEEHVPGLLQVPGFLAGGRYVAVRGGPRIWQCTNWKVATSCAPPRSSTRSPRLTGYMEHDEGSPGVYQRICPPITPSS